MVEMTLSRERCRREGEAPSQRRGGGTRLGTVGLREVPGKGCAHCRGVTSTEMLLKVEELGGPHLSPSQGPGTSGHLEGGQLRARRARWRR